MRIIGLDPGLRNLGWGVIELSGNKQTHIAHGVCHSGEGEMAIRLARLHEALAEVFATHQPDEAAVEHVFVNSDGAASLKLGQARAICLLVPAQLGLSVAEYAPNQIKKLVVGQGHANKEQVKYMLSMLLPGVRPSSLDASDALAIALAHAQIAASTRKLDAALLQAGAG